VRFALTDLVSVRVDVRDNLTQKNGAPRGSLTAHVEALSSLTVRFYSREKPPAPPPPAPVSDIDGDGFVGDADKCPKRAGQSPDGCPAPDLDADGFPDQIDQCPRMPGGPPQGCPTTDSDRDGFADHIDRCPARAGVEPDGCPGKDSDSDEIVDSEDRCPLQPETRNHFRDDDGCADEIPGQVRRYLGVVEGIRFVGGHDTFRPGAREVMDGLVEMLKEYPEVRIRVTSHTDGRGDAEYNMELSRRRAEAVRGYLIDQGIEAGRIETRGAGAEEPVASSATAAGRRLNRRIEVQLVPHRKPARPTSDEPAEAAPVGEAPF
jgi:outer membrane protein OmpA-like peptidoglycan-associated protein